MALVVTASGYRKVGLGYDDATGEAGIVLRVQLGENVAKGDCLAVSGAADNQYLKQANEYDTTCIAAEAGSANGYIWAWTTGSICQVLFKENTASVRGYVAISDAVDGRGNNIDLATIGGNPSIDTHFKEIGHVKESKGAVEGVSNLVLIHFHTL